MAAKKRVFISFDYDHGRKGDPCVKQTSSRRSRRMQYRACFAARRLGLALMRVPILGE